MPRSYIDCYYDTGAYEFDTNILILGEDFDVSVQYDYDHAEGSIELRRITLERYCGPVPVLLPGGVIVSPSELDADTYDRLADDALSHWEASGAYIGDEA